MRRVGSVLLFHLSVLGVGFLVVATGMVAEASVIGGFGSFMVLFDVLCWNRIPLARVFSQRRILSHQCGYCQQEFPLYGRWRCGCGTISPRHAFSPCPSQHCGLGFEYVVCPHCGTSHFI